ncbi:MAG: hypothetical protein SF162_00275 [bacterium]|nr:hypothetical protein [bacterium]
MSDETRAAYYRLRRLQEHNLSNIPSLIAQRALSSFTLQEEEASEAASTVRVLVYPQDPFVGEPEVRIMAAVDIRPGLVNSRVRIHDSEGEPAQPDADGNYYYEPGTREFDQVNAFYYATFTLRMFERYAHRELPWSFPSPRLDVNPHVGQGANAFYSEQDRMLGFYGMEHNGESFVAAQSADVVSHETAHAVLDGLRDLYNESFGLGPMSFHESFGDMAAVLVALHDDSLITRFLDLTGGNLRTNNFIAALAEWMSKASPPLEEHVQEHTMYLRNAINHFHAVPFDAMSYRASQYDTELAREAHNYSRLFTGAFYDVLVGIYEKLRGEMSPRIALHRTRHIMGQMLVCAVEIGPVGEFDYADMAKSFLTAARYLYPDAYNDVLIKVFAERQILPEADARQHIAAQDALPEVQLPRTLNSALASALLLEETIIPALKLPPDANLTPLAAYRNAEGTAYLTYFSHRRITLTGAEYRQFNGSNVDLFGGLTLMFNRNGWLTGTCYRPVTDADVAQINVLTRDLIEQGLIADPLHGSTMPEPPPLHLAENRPKALWVPDVTGDLPPLDAPMQPLKPSKLVKFPVIFDHIPRSLSRFGEYLQSWRARGR